MQPLTKSLRTTLENCIQKARDVSEEAAKASLEQLSVGDENAFSHLNTEDKELRRKLRTHGRQLGDTYNSTTKKQEISLLVEEVAYEHWHRMLFARFLAENDLLMYPDPKSPTAVSLADCEELAREQGVRNGWELAARFASLMLPQIFRISSPVFGIHFSLEYQTQLEKLLSDLPKEIFTASDSLGWVYQFWQSKRKDEINKSEVKIGSRELPSVTQLFTEPYMVSFLLDNSLGAWWANQKLNPTDLETATTEKELRSKAATSSMPLEYLRFVKRDTKWDLASGTFAKWPKDLRDFKVIDPCCGSGHFLVAVFLMLVAMRMDLEHLTAKEAIDLVFKENIHGLDIDKRVTEITAFALALTAWKYPDAGGYRPLPELNIACSGLAVGVEKSTWQKLAGTDTNLKTALGWLYDEFQNAPVLGSLLDPSKSDAAKLVKWDDLSSTLTRALEKEKSEEELEAGVVAQGLAKAGSMLTAKYHWVVTNVPYLARGKQSEVLKNFSERNYSEAKNDLATVFLDRTLDYCNTSGTASIVLPQNWLFLTSYKKFREKLLKQEEWNFVARLGAGAFETISGEVVKAILVTLSKRGFQPLSSSTPNNLFPNTNAPIHYLRGIDVSAANSPTEKAEMLLNEEIKTVDQAKQLENPDARVAFGEASDINLLSRFSFSYQGISPADFPRFGRLFWEGSRNGEWIFWQSTIEHPNNYGGREKVLWMSEVTKKASEEGTAYIRGEESWGKDGVVVSAMRDLLVTLGKGNPSDTNVAIIVPNDESHLTAIWCFCSSPEYNEAVRQIDQSLKVTNATLVKVPFDLDHWTKVAEEKYPFGLPLPYSDDPTQWIFHGHPCGSVVWSEPDKEVRVAPTMRVDETVLQVAVARLLGYRWPSELDEVMELADEQRSWVTRCNPLLDFVDEDGIVCIPPVRGEEKASDRIIRILAASYGDEWNGDVLAKLLDSVGYAGKTLEAWLRDGFFTQHCKVFQHRPFLWQIWDGLPDGFSVLVNYHKFDYKNLETLVYTYLGDWMTRQKQDIQNKVDGAEEKLAAAERLEKQLKLILQGEEPYDIFVRWKSLKDQPIGWNPDLNDGVRLNIRPFLSGLDLKKKGAGILRDKPNIKWDKDRGKDVKSAPWFHKFNGDRINDHHTTLAEKKKGE